MPTAKLCLKQSIRFIVRSRIGYVLCDLERIVPMILRYWQDRSI